MSADNQDARIEAAKKTIAELENQPSPTKADKRRLREAHVLLATIALQEQGLKPTADAIRYVIAGGHITGA